MTDPTTDSPATSMCTYGEGQASGSGCIKRAGHDGAHLVTPGVPAERDLWRAPAAAPAGPAPTTDRNTLRERIAEALVREDAHNAGYDHGFVGQYGLDDETDGFVDAVLAAVLPAPDQQTAVLAEQLVERCPDHGCVEPAWEDGCHCEVVPLLRRLAGEAQQDPAQGGEAACSNPGHHAHPGFTCAEVDQTRPFWEGRWADTAPARSGHRYTVCRCGHGSAFHDGPHCRLCAEDSERPPCSGYQPST